MKKLLDPFGGSRIVFGCFCLCPSKRLLMRDGAPVNIGGRSLDLLTVLTENPGRVLSKRELIERVWPDVVVEEGSLRFHMAVLRKALGDGLGGARYITTQVGVGYAFVATVEVIEEAPPAARPAALVERDTSSSPASGKLPTRNARIVGREESLRVVQDQLGHCRLVSIVGAAGVGKTTLAVELGHSLEADYAGRVHFVDFGALENPALVPSAIANALGIPVQGDDPAGVVLGHVRSQRLLLIFDNCEHLIDAISASAESFGEAAPDVRVLATSREPLRIPGEQVHWLGPLECPPDGQQMPLEAILGYPAVQLFLDRALAASGDLAIDLPAAQQIADICRRLDGMALPIELTAGRIALHGLDSTASLIGERFSLAWTGRRNAIARHQTLEATLDWSYDLLPQIERRTLERLSVFIGTFSMEAAIQIVSDNDMETVRVAAALDALTVKSMIASDRTSEPNGYRLLEMTRAYARAKFGLQDQEVRDQVARRHARYYLDLIKDVTSTDGSLSHQPVRLNNQIGNIRAALGTAFGPQGDPMLSVELTAACIPVFFNMSLFVECRTWTARAVAALDDETRGTAAEYEVQAALGLTLMFTRGNSDAAEKALRRALEIAVALDDPLKQLRLLGRLHIFHERIGDYATAFGWVRMALEVADGIGEPEAIAVASSLSGISHHLAGDQFRARKDLERAVRNSLPSERWRTLYYGFDHRNRSLIALARTYWLRGDGDRARRFAEDAVREAAGLDHPTTHCIALIWASPVFVAIGDFKRAAEILDSFEAIAEINRFGPYVAAVRGLRAGQMVRRGVIGDALAWTEESLARLRAARYELLTVSFSISLALGLMLASRNAEALELVDTMLARCSANDELIYQPELLRIKAAILALPTVSDGAEVEGLLEESIACSRAQGALAWELRTTMDLGRIWQKRGDITVALDSLRSLRARFEGGADAPDLREADDLIEQLSQLQQAACKA